MRGSYDNEWKNAFEGKSIAPSEAVWENIASSMDRGYGKRNWVTILLIAATVSIAFAFPLTVGNSSFEAQPHNFELSDSAQPSDSSEINSHMVPNRKLPVFANKPDADNTRSGALVQASESLISSLDEQLVNEQAVDMVGAEVERLTLSDMETIADDDLGTDFYIIPFFTPLNQDSESGILALASLSTGNRSVSNGVNGMEMFAASADFENVFLNSNQGDIRSEEGGTTYNIGLGVEIPLGKKWSLISGLGYMIQRAPGTSNIVYDDNGTYVPMGTYSPIKPGTIFLADSYSYISENQFVNIPVVLKYPIIDRKFKLRLGAGLSNDFMIRNSIVTQEYADAKNNVGDTNYAPYGLTGLLNLDIRFKLTDSYSLAFETGLRKGFTSINGSGERYPTSFNLGIMLFYQFQ